MEYPENNEQVHPSHMRRFFHVARQGQTWLNVLYLLAAFPLGIFYFVFLVTMLGLGLGLLIIWIGIPILLATMAAWWGFAAFERIITMHWLHVNIPPMSYTSEPKGSVWGWRRLWAHMSHAATWKGLAYLFVKSLFGTFAFIVAVTLLSVSIVLILAPLGYILNTYIYALVNPAPGTVQDHYLFLTIDGHFNILALLSMLPITVLGIPFGVMSLRLLNGLAYVWGQFAQVMLGMSVKDMQLAEARTIAERERMRAGRADQSRKELIVNVSHELRTPIASIRGHVESLLLATDEEANKAPSPEEMRNYLTIVYREAERLNELVDDLLSLARAESDELHLTLAPTSAGEVVEEVYQTLAPLARRERQIMVVREIAPNLPPIVADRQRLVQVLLNLVRNAITYTPTGGIVSITLNWAAADRLELVVADTGIGIPPEDLERVFERFYRTDASRTRTNGTSGGFGLGLAIVRDLVSAMGGSVTAQSKVGEGSRFRVLLQVATQYPYASYPAAMQVQAAGQNGNTLYPSKPSSPTGSYRQPER